MTVSREAPARTPRNVDDKGRYDLPIRCSASAWTPLATAVDGLRLTGTERLRRPHRHRRYAISGARDARCGAGGRGDFSGAMLKIGRDKVRKASPNVHWRKATPRAYRFRMDR